LEGLGLRWSRAVSPFRNSFPQITAFRPPRRFQQTPLKSTGSLSPLSPLWFVPCPRSGGLTTEDTEDTEKEGLADGPTCTGQGRRPSAPRPPGNSYPVIFGLTPERHGWDTAIPIPPTFLSARLDLAKSPESTHRPGKFGNLGHGRQECLRYVALGGIGRVATKVSLDRERLRSPQ